MDSSALRAGHPASGGDLDLVAFLHQSPRQVRRGEAVSDSQANWERLAALLSDRRTRLNPQYKSRLKFVEDTGLNQRLVSDLENARRTSYRPTTLGAVETAYRWAPGSIERVLAGGDPVEVAPVSASASLAVTGHTEAESGPAEERSAEALEVAIRELARRLSPDRVRAILEGLAAPRGPHASAAERRYEDEAEQHLWETPGLDERQRRYLIHQLDALRRLDATDSRSIIAPPSAEVREFRPRV